jgi:hypothetical protein
MGAKISPKHRAMFKRATKRYVGSLTTVAPFEWPKIRWDVVCAVLITLRLL